MLARDLVLKTFQEYGVEYLFGNPGTTELPLLDGLVNFPDIQFIVSLHEDICVGMAAGYAQATGKPGVVNLHATPGVSHGLGNIYNAYRAGVPLVVTAGQQDVRLAVQEPALAGDMVSMAKGCTKWSFEIKNAHELPVVLQRAFKLAMTEPKGPVLLSFPSDIMWHEIDAEPIPLTTIPEKARGDQDAIKQAANLLMEAKQPIIVSGDRIGRTNSVEAIANLSELIGAEVYIEHHAGELNFPYTHANYSGRFLPNGPFIADALADADVVLFAGVLSQAPLLFYDGALVKPDTKVIFIDSGEWEVGKNMHVDCPIIGHPGTILEEIEAGIKKLASEKDRLRFQENQQRTIKKNSNKKNQHMETLKKQFDQVPLSPSRVMYELNQFIDEETLIVDESVTTSMYVHRYLELTQPASFIGLKGGGLGYGMPAALGAQLGRKNKRVVNILGDGSSLYYIQSLWNAAKHELPVIFLIINNTSYMILKGGILNINGESAKKGVFYGMDLDQPTINFPQVANGLGIESLRVKTPEELQAAYQKAFSERKPFLIDIIIDRSVNVFLK